MRRHPCAKLGLAVLALYGAAVTILPLLHNAWHHLAHHGHDDDAAAEEETNHHAPGDERDGEPYPDPGGPQHGAGAPEHFGLSLCPAAAAPPVLLLALAPAIRLALDTTVFQSSFRSTPAHPRAPPQA